MRRRALGGLAVMLALAACGESRLNPANWFGGSSEGGAVAVVDVVADPRPLVSEVTSLTIDRTPTGAIVRARGLPPTQGWWAAELVPVDSEDPADVVYEFRVVPPPGPTPSSTPRSREIVVATFIPNQRLAQVRRITVQGQNSSRTSGR
jgi:hypothetical protein